MNRGISFTVEQQIGDVLFEVLKRIGASDYWWHVVQSQTEAMDEGFENDIFTHDYYDGKELLNCNFHNSCIVFLKLEAYAKKCFPTTISNYADFKTCDCRILVLVYDCYNAEIYVKNSNLLQSISVYLQNHGGCRFQIITDDNDFRTQMNVI